MSIVTWVLSVATSLVIGQCYVNSAIAGLVLDGAAVSDEIRIGNIMPYTGPLAAFSSIGRAEAAYFDMVNDHGGINGRDIVPVFREICPVQSAGAFS